MKTLTLKLTNLFAFEQWILKTKRFFNSFVTKPVVAEVDGEQQQQRIETVAMSHKKITVSKSFMRLPNEALLAFSKNVILNMRFSTHTSLELSIVTHLMYAVAKFEDTFVQSQFIKNEVVHFNLKNSRKEVEKLLAELAKGREQRAELQPEYARIIITGAGFEMKN